MPHIQTMADTCSIIRRSINTFLQNYQYYTSTPTLLVFPYASSYLYFLSLIPTLCIFSLIHNHLTSLLLAAGFPSSSYFFRILSVNISGNILTSLFVSPSALSFLLLAKASVILKAGNRKPMFSDCVSVFKRLIATQLWNSMFKFAVHATCFFLAAMILFFFEILGLSLSQGPLFQLFVVVGAMAYSFLIANSEVVCSFALVSSGMENKGGFASIAHACVVMFWGRMEVGLSLTLAVNLAMAGIEGLFLLWVRMNHGSVSGSDSNSIMLVVGGVLIACLYSVLLVLESVIGCTFWRYCFELNNDRIPEDNMCCRDRRIEVRDGDCDKPFVETNTSDMIP